LEENDETTVSKQLNPFQFRTDKTTWTLGKSCYPQFWESLGEKSSRLFFLGKRLIGTQCLQGKRT